MCISSTSASLVSGITASDTPDDQVPRIACTLLTSSSFFAASTPAWGLVWVSSDTTSSIMPAAPPAAFTASAPARIIRIIPLPNVLPDPVTGVSAPTRNTAGCARSTVGMDRIEVPMAAPCSRRRR